MGTCEEVGEVAVVVKAEDYKSICATLGLCSDDLVDWMVSSQAACDISEMHTPKSRAWSIVCFVTHGIGIGRDRS